MEKIIQTTRQEEYESPVVKSLQMDQVPVICHSTGTLDEVDIVDAYDYDDIN